MFYLLNNLKTKGSLLKHVIDVAQARPLRSG